MTIASGASVVSYLGNGATTVFPFTFHVPAEDEIEVIVVTNATLARVSKTLNVDFSVDVETGEVTYPLVGSPMPATETILILRNLSLEQTTSYSTQGNFSPTTLEQALDYVTMLVQQVLNRFSPDFKGVNLQVYTLATLPAATAVGWAPRLVYIVDATGGGIPCFSDGTNWRRVDTREIVS